MSSAHLTLPAGRLPPTTESLLDDKARPYFLWWTNVTVGQFKEHLVSSDPEERAYWMGALLREANTRDVDFLLAWLLAQFPTLPLPTMLEPLTSAQLEEFRDALAERSQGCQVVSASMCS